MGQRYREKDISWYDLETALRQHKIMFEPWFIGRQKSPRRWFWKNGRQITPCTRQEKVDHGYRFYGWL